MRSLVRGAAVASVLLLITGPVAAAQTGLTAQLTNDAETHPVVPTLETGAPRPVSFGFATFTLSADQTTLVWTAIVNNIDVTGSQTADTNDDLVAAHIHAGPGVAPGVNGPVVWGFFGAPFNDTDPTDTELVPFIDGVGGTFTSKWDLTEGNGTTLAEQVPNILGGRAYINFHTRQFPAGEIRGDLAVVPEPSTVLLLGSGLAGLGLMARRRRAR
ncbi:MAG TPA: CHRD domain-containing protein [Gemmatimonadales bacterium]